MTEIGFHRAIGQIEGARGKKYSQQERDSWWEVLKGCEDEKLFDAAVNLCRHRTDSRRNPEPGDLLAAYWKLSKTALQEQSIEQRLKRFNERASREAGERLRRGNEDELRFQRYMLRKCCLEGLTEQDRAMFHRTLGQEEIDTAESWAAR